MKTNLLPFAAALLIFVVLSGACGSGEDQNFEAMVDDLLEGSVEQITARQLREREGEFTLLDARPEEEFEVAHLEGAIRVGFDDFEASDVEDLDRDQPIVVYCSVGYRSERIGEQLQELGFENVHNLRGGIFDWFNRGFPVFNAGGETNEVHPYDQKWGRWVKERD